jgi:hypothetical protein
MSSIFVPTGIRKGVGRRALGSVSSCRRVRRKESSLDNAKELSGLE